VAAVGWAGSVDGVGGSRLPRPSPRGGGGRRETVTQTREPWHETVAEFSGRLREICQHVNSNYDVEGLCRKRKVEKKEDMHVH
jgi:hypothetical protein